LDRYFVPDTAAEKSLGPILNDHHRVAIAGLVSDGKDQVPIKGHILAVEPVQALYAPERKVRKVRVRIKYLFDLAGSWLNSYKVARPSRALPQAEKVIFDRLTFDQRVAGEENASWFTLTRDPFVNASEAVGPTFAPRESNPRPVVIPPD